MNNSIKQCCALLFLAWCSTSAAGDLDDGIKMDELINDDLKLDVNIQYIKRRAKAAAQTAKNETSKTQTSCVGTGNQIFGAGSNLQGATIVNISDNRKSNSVCTN